MNFVDKAIEAYAQRHSQPMSNAVKRIDDWTRQHSDESQMLSGALQVAILQLLALSVRAARILEIGMFTGLSALAMAEVLPDDGELITLDIEPEREKIARGFFDQSPHGEKIQIVIAPALDAIESLGGAFDLAYIDADKENYLNYYEAVLPRMREGGLIVADNVLWSGSVLAADSQASQALNQYNRLVHADARVTSVLLPVRDGLMIARKN